MNRLLPHPLLTLVLAMIWVLLVNELSAGAVILGLLLGWAIPLFTRSFWPERVAIRHPLTLLRYTGVVLGDIVIANFVVAGRILLGPKHVHPAFVAIPLDLETDLAISLLANTICLTPGTVSAQLSPDRRQLLVHALNTSDPEEVVRTIKQRYEAPLKKVFES